MDPAPNVGFVAEDGIAHVIIVRHLYFVEQDDVLKFCRITYDCTFADDRISADKLRTDGLLRSFR